MCITVVKNPASQRLVKTRTRKKLVDERKTVAFTETSQGFRLPFCKIHPCFVKSANTFCEYVEPFVRCAEESNPRCHPERSGWVPVARLQRIMIDGSADLALNHECTLARLPDRSGSEAISASPLEPRGGARPIFGTAWRASRACRTAATARPAGEPSPQFLFH